MLRGALLAFIGGWIIWFWIDKNPQALGPLPYPADGNYLHNFQVTVDLLKQSRIKAAYVYLWKAHHLVLSLAIGFLSGIVITSITRARSLNKMRKMYAGSLGPGPKNSQGSDDA